MLLSDISIKRPIFITMVISALIVLGVFTYSKIPIDLMPEVDFPIVSVVSVYPGADPETIERDVLKKIEDAVSTVSGIRMIRSTAATNVGQIVIMFELEVDIDIAAQDVRDRVASIQNDLPSDLEPPTVQKVDLGALPIMYLVLSGDMQIDNLSQIAKDEVQERLQQIQGVGGVEIIGERKKEIQILVDIQKLRNYGLTVIDIVQLIGSGNVDIPGGHLTDSVEEINIKFTGRATSLSELENLTVVSFKGSIVKLKDIARVVESMEEERSRAEFNGKKAVAILIRKQSGKNAVAVSNAIKTELDRIRQNLPSGLNLDMVMDGTKFTKESIHDVEFDLILGAILAVLVISIFLRNIRATIISALAIPTSVIATFTFIWIMGFTLNIIVMMALSISIGMLVDDAIVVIENIFRHLEEKETTVEAARKGTSEIGLAVMATTFSIVGVFVPVAFMKGMIGRFLYQFGLTVSFAVLISLFVSFTLTPMLSSRILRLPRPNFFTRGVEAVLKAIDKGYSWLLRGALKLRWLTVLIGLGAFVSGVYLFMGLGQEMVPSLDSSNFYINIKTPIGSSLSRTYDMAERVANIATKMPGITSVYVETGGGVMEEQNSAKILVNLVPKEERNFSQTEFMAHIRKRLSKITGAEITLSDAAGMGAGSGIGSSAPLQFVLRGHDLKRLEQYSQKLMEKLSKIKGFVDLSSSLEKGQPEIDIVIDRNRAGEMNIVGSQVGQTLRFLIAGVVVSKYEQVDDDYDIRVKLDPVYRNDPELLKLVTIRSTKGSNIDLGNISTFNKKQGNAKIERDNRQRQIMIMSNLDGLALGDAMNHVSRIAKQIIPPDINTQYRGMSDFIGESFDSLKVTLLLAIIFIYMILAAQFESFVHPFTIMFSLPVSLIGAAGALWLTKTNLSIFAFIGIIMLMGLVTKNAILLVDYTNTLRSRGLSRHDALLKAGPIRLRPILMTTLAMIFGMLPIALGRGAAAEIKAGLGIVVIGGLITSLFLTLVVVPSVYTYMDDIQNFIYRILGITKKQELITANKPEEITTN